MAIKIPHAINNPGLAATPATGTQEMQTTPVARVIAGLLRADFNIESKTSFADFEQASAAITPFT